MFSSDADLFFWNPRDAKESPDSFGNLYLLRRDIDQCMGINPTTGMSGEAECLWPAAMATMAGFDLLAKFYACSDIGTVTTRFLGYLEKYSTLSATERMTIYQLRNSLMHSFGLYSEDKKTKKIYRYQLTNGSGTFIKHFPPETYRVDLKDLHKIFESTVSSYQKDLENDPILQVGFKKMFLKYGKTYID